MANAHTRNSRRTKVLIGLILLLFTWGGLVGYKACIQKKMHIWLPGYVNWLFRQSSATRKPGEPTHIMFLCVDHFEPSDNTDKVREWVDRYPKLCENHRDADGRYPRHTWAYPIEQTRKDHLELLSRLCRKGYGEIEFQLHHSNDTSESFRERLRKAKRDFSEAGALVTLDEKEAFAYVAGNWALDNSRLMGERNLSGVNDELRILKEEGCFADFTFPALNTTAQPRKINSIYYAIDDPLNPKSYDTGKDVAVGELPVGDLMIFQGPLLIDWLNLRHKFYPALNSDTIGGAWPPSKRRADLWVKANVHVKKRGDWIFVKTHTHGASNEDMPVVLGPEMDALFSYLESTYDDGSHFKLHYVTAREAYNIVKAAEAGLAGNPNDYRDYFVKPYKNSIPDVNIQMGKKLEQR